MKRLSSLLFTLALVLTSSLFGQHVADHANLLAGQTARLEADLSNLPVYVETYRSRPPGYSSLRDYADSKAQTLAPSTGGFLIVVTTDPREWRISMSPRGVVSGQATEPIGQRMVGYMRNGDFYAAFSHAATDLNRLLQPKTAAPAPVVPTTPVATPPPAADSPKEEISSGRVWTIVIVGAVLFVAAAAVIVYRLREQERQRELEEERERKERRERWQREVNEREAREAKERAERIEAERAKAKTVLEAPERQKEAQDLYNRYTAAQRSKLARQYTSSAHYSSACSSDPLQFYMLLWLSGALDHHGCVHSHAASCLNETPSAAASSISSDSAYSSRSSSSSSSSRSSSSDDDYHRRSSSDSYSSSSSWDSGGSSGSWGGSDSGGSGGSW